jgi:hypothetical protein
LSVLKRIATATHIGTIHIRAQRATSRSPTGGWITEHRFGYNG